MGFERGAILALARRPSLIGEAMRAGFAMRSHHSLRPSRSYLGWRAFTAYGDRMATASAEDLVYYLSWRRETRIIAKWGRAE
jgi:hypothetical protein